MVERNRPTSPSSLTTTSTVTGPTPGIVASRARASASSAGASATGCPGVDTQTGLRGYPAALLDWLCRVPGERFEYEMNVLLHAARSGVPIEQTVIATTYLGDNGSSHFGSLKDSARVYRPLLRHALTPSARSRG